MSKTLVTYKHPNRNNMPHGFRFFEADYRIVTEYVRWFFRERAKGQFEYSGVMFDVQGFLDWTQIKDVPVNGMHSDIAYTFENVELCGEYGEFPTEVFEDFDDWLQEHGGDFKKKANLLAGQLSEKQVNPRDTLSLL